MMKKKYRVFTVLAMTMALGMTMLTGCGGTVQGSATDGTEEIVEVAAVEEASASVVPETGVLYVKVNPEVAVRYDDQGIVTAVEGVNADGVSLVQNAEQFIGRACREVVLELVEDIHEAGYFLEEIEGENRQIVIEVERGSAMPNQEFLNEIVADIKSYVSTMHLTGDIEVEGVTDYVSTDYGPNADGVTDYDTTDYAPDAGSGGAAVTIPAENPSSVPATPVSGSTDYGVTDYDDTDYGPNADGVTDYDDTDYDVTDYTAPAPAPAPAPEAAAPAAPAAPAPVPASGSTDYGSTDYDDTDYGPNADGVTDYDDGASNYDSASDYDDGVSDYDDGASDYGNSDYDD